ncbi:hypothetical protein DOE78_03985 [Bacillus sp. Y1]|nr:hypothetical protein DOE78_03985 [Bacillus sp. Y1]
MNNNSIDIFIDKFIKIHWVLNKLSLRGYVKKYIIRNIFETINLGIRIKIHLHNLLRIKGIPSE